MIHVEKQIDVKTHYLATSYPVSPQEVDSNYAFCILHTSADK